MATVPTLISLDQYLCTSFRPDADYVDGEIEERNLGEFEHATLQSAISGWFWPRRSEWDVHPVVEQRIRVAGTRVRIVDIALLRADAPREKVTQTAPLLCIEILSPEDRVPRVKVRLADYLGMGVSSIWLIDPIRRTASTYDASGLHDADPNNLGIPGTPIYLDLTEAFAAID